MASISTNADGKRRILFKALDGRRKTVHLGKSTKKLADLVKLRVESLIAAASARVPLDNETAAWVGGIGDDLAAKLAAVGLIPERRSKQISGMKAYFTKYVEGRPDVAANTRRNLLQAILYLSGFFGEARHLQTVTPGDAVRFASHMRANYSMANANRTIVHAKQFFKVAVQDELIERNPFRDVKGGSMTNSARMHFVTAEQTVKLLDACPDGEWRLIVALARLGGLRTPSEHLVLTWADIDWERNRFLVRSPKTGPRWVPIFPELLPHLEEAFDRAEAGAVHVVTRTRDASANWRTTFAKIIVRAGLIPWEKPFQNLRASRETELMQHFPIHVVTAWIGNSVPVAAKHYLQVTDDDFNRATRREGDAKSDADVTQNATQTGAISNRLGMPGGGKTTKIKANCSSQAFPVLHGLYKGVPREGVEPSNWVS